MDKPKSKIRPWALKKPDGPPIARRTRDEFYHTSRWKRESKDFLQQNPLCIQCGKEGYLIPATITDHIIPKNTCKDPWDRSNWQPLCKRHNLTKGAQDKKYFKK
jgi:5-methylcytosine-specific restriction endonuclease McrA